MAQPVRWCNLNIAVGCGNASRMKHYGVQQMHNAQDVAKLREFMDSYGGIVAHIVATEKGCLLYWKPRSATEAQPSALRKTLSIVIS